MKRKQHVHRDSGKSREQYYFLPDPHGHRPSQIFSGSGFFERAFEKLVRCADRAGDGTNFAKKSVRVLRIEFSTNQLIFVLEMKPRRGDEKADL